MAKVLTRSEIEEIVENYECWGFGQCIRERMLEELIGTRQQPLYDAAIKAFTDLDDYIETLKKGLNR